MHYPGFTINKKYVRSGKCLPFTYTCRHTPTCTLKFMSYLHFGVFVYAKSAIVEKSSRRHSQRMLQELLRTCCGGAILVSDRFCQLLKKPQDEQDHSVEGEHGLGPECDPNLTGGRNHDSAFSELLRSLDIIQHWIPLSRIVLSMWAVLDGFSPHFCFGKI